MVVGAIVWWTLGILDVTKVVGRIQVGGCGHTSMCMQSWQCRMSRQLRNAGESITDSLRPPATFSC